MDRKYTNLKIAAAGAAVAIACGLGIGYDPEPQTVSATRTIEYQKADDSLHCIEETRRPHVPEMSEQETAVGMIMARPWMTGKPVPPINMNGSQVECVAFEPDRDYARHLVQEAEKSIDNLFDFLDNDILKKPDIELTIPSEGNEINVKDEHAAYFLVDLQTKIESKFTYFHEGQEDGVKTGSMGSSYGHILNHNHVLFPEGRPYVWKHGGPIFLRTDHPPNLNLIVPASEVLHKSFKEITSENINRNVQDRFDKHGMESEDIYFTIADKGRHQEEVMVHALTKVWARRYFQERGRDTGAEFEQIFIDEESSGPNYHGLNPMAEYIEEIGTKQAIELYASDVEKLFEAIE